MTAAAAPGDQRRPVGLGSAPDAVLAPPPAQSIALALGGGRSGRARAGPQGSRGARGTRGAGSGVSDAVLACGRCSELRLLIGHR